MFEYGSELLNDFGGASALEWLETNGIGGWASSSLTFANTRRYHGILVAGSRTRPERTVLVARLDETLKTAEGSFELASNQFDGVIHPAGYRLMESFRKDIFPEVVYRCGSVRLRKTIITPRGENTTIVLYELIEGDGPLELRLRPFYANRDYHSLVRRESFAMPLVHVRIDGSKFESHADWWRGFEYPIERERGLDDHEDLFTPGEYVVKLQKGSLLPVVMSTEDPAGRDLLALIDAEHSRREALVESKDDLVRALTLAADQFIIDRDVASPMSNVADAAAQGIEDGPGREDPAAARRLQTVIAGYHWFTDWGRDTMISLPGLCLVTRRFEDAKNILRRFIAAASKGMMPNRFPDGTDVPAYNSVDAGLWFFVAVWKYFDHTWDVDFVRNEAAPVLFDMLAWLDRGTRYNIHVDDDGLLYAGASGVQLTWMDAKAGDEVFTPRCGKPVEINALFYNALRITARLTDSEELAERAEKVRVSFEKAFWNARDGCCFDVIGPDDASIRPNQLLVLSLPFPLFGEARAEQILATCEQHLLTPRGLRSLSPYDSRYRGRLIGNQWARDSAYHQGTVWSWLLGPYMTALCRVRGERGRQQSRDLLDAFLPHLRDEAGIGTISEIFDGDAPHLPRGCIAQAWSVAELLRAYLEDVDG
ncbi:MAG: amylo-alpha-1,6-glucosidase [Acidobacteriota bacterium]